MYPSIRISKYILDYLCRTLVTSVNNFRADRDNANSLPHQALLLARQCRGVKLDTRTPLQSSKDQNKLCDASLSETSSTSPCTIGFTWTTCFLSDQAEGKDLHFMLQLQRVWYRTPIQGPSFPVFFCFAKVHLGASVAQFFAKSGVLAQMVLHFHHCWYVFVESRRL